MCINTVGRFLLAHFAQQVPKFFYHPRFHSGKRGILCETGLEGVF